MKQLRIISCDDSHKWYANKIGQLVPLLAIEAREYKSLEDDGITEGHRFVNFVSKEDAVIEEIKMIDTKVLLTLLKESIQVVTFTKVNGDKRVMTCTLMEDKIPAAKKDDSITHKKVREYNDKICVVWDVKASGFRSFRVENVTEVSDIELGGTSVCYTSTAN